MINPRHLDLSALCTPSKTRRQNANSLLSSFASVAFGYDDGFDGFIPVCKKVNPMANVPYNSRPIIPDPKDPVPNSPDRDLEKEREEAIEKREKIQNKINYLEAECKAYPGDRGLCEHNGKEIEKLRAEYKAILLPRPLYIRPWMKPMFSYRTSEMETQIQSLQCPYIDMYIGANRYTSTKTFAAKQLLGYNNIVIDLDIHNDYATTEEISKVLAVFLDVAFEEFFADCDNHTPNAIVYTGRGLQLWYTLVPIHPYCKTMYRGMANYLIDGIQSFIDDHKNALPNFSLIKIDKAVSLRDSGLYRMPCSYNISAGTWGNAAVIHADQLNLPKEYDKLLHAGLVTPPKKVKHKDAIENNFIDIAEKRVESLKILVSYREKMHKKNLRDQTLLIVYCAYLTATGDKDNAMCKTKAFNRMFSSPMPEKELKAYMSTAKRIGGYKFSNERIIEWLDITPEEQDLIGLHAVAKRENKGTGHSTKKLHLDEQILAACEKGLNKKQIAAEVGCSPQTVKRVLDRHKVKTLKEKLSEGIRRAYEFGWNVSRQEKKYGRTMSRGGKRYLKKKAAERVVQKLLSAKQIESRKKESEEKNLSSAQVAEVKEAKPKAKKQNKVEYINEEYLRRIYPWLSGT